MENVTNISSEEELLGLRNEGKISEAEYQDLLTAMRKPSSNGGEEAAPEIEKAKSKRKLGKIAFVLMLAGILLPVIPFFAIELLSGPNTRAAIGPFFFLGAAFEIAAFVTGVLSWPDVYGKASVLTTSILAVLSVLLIVLIA
ncbi:MAG: hypothetical protein KAY65_04125 [Planctomycetes bacterium]|nr:hypothetical protein [Planctomycetota bacterium]